GALLFSIWMMRNAVGSAVKDLDATLLKIPVLGSFYERFIRRETPYREDTRLMYLQTVPVVVKEIVEAITASKGIKLLKQFEQRSALSEAYQPLITRLDHTGEKPLPMMVVSMTPFANAPRGE